MIEWAQRILLESNAFLSGWNHLGSREHGSPQNGFKLNLLDIIHSSKAIEYFYFVEEEQGQ